MISESPQEPDPHVSLLRPPSTLPSDRDTCELAELPGERREEKNLRGKSFTGSLWSTDAAGDVINERPVEVECAAETETGLLFEYQLHLGTKSFSRRVGRGKTNLHGIPYGRHLHRSGLVDVSCRFRPTLNAFQSDWICKSHETTYKCLDMTLQRKSVGFFGLFCL